MSERILKDIISGDDAKDLLLSGLKKASDVVSSTYGYRGRTVLIESDYGKAEPTKDGYDTLQSIFLENPVENIALEIAKEASEKTVKFAGDAPQPLYSKILTPKGWTTMGNLKVGSVVCGTNNTKQTVLGVYPKGEREILKVKFSDGRTVECCEEHFWTVSDTMGNKKTITAKAIIDNGLFKTKKNGTTAYNYYVQTTSVEFNKSKKITLDPYLVGILIGDGSLSASGSSTIELSLGYKKRHVLDKIVLPKGIVFTAKDYDKKNYIRVKFKGKDENGKNLKSYLNDIGLLGTLSKTKFIPKEYLYSDLNDRKALLQGLSDTDGHINNRGLLEFSTCSEKLKLDFIELCRSLGMQLHTYSVKNGANSFKENTISHRITQLKGYNNGIKIIDIERTGVMTEMQCIKVSNEDSLYITDDYVVTHNTTNTVILLYAFFKNSVEVVKNGKSPIDVKREIEKSRDLILEHLDKISTPITDKLIYDVALTSANGDEEIAKIVSEAYIKAGADGSVSHARSNTDESYLEFIDGTLVESGYSDERFVNVFSDRTCVFDDSPLIVCSTIEFKTVKQILPFMQYAHDNKKALVIIADCAPAVRDVVLQNVMQKGVPFCVVHCPGVGKKRLDSINDLACILGTQAITTLSGDNFEGREGEFIGTCEKIVVGKADTIITPVKNDYVQKIVDGKIAEIKETIATTKSQVEEKYLRERISKLVGGVSVIKVGSIIESELKEKIARVDDAVCAVRSAKEEGVLAGGGIALLEASHLLEVGGIATLACNTPFHKLMQNAGIESLGILTDRYPNGYDVKNFCEVNMFDAGIVDSTKAIKHALINAVSASNTMLMTDAVLTNKRMV